MTHSVGRRRRHAVVNRDVVAQGYRWGGGGGGEAAAVLRENPA